MGFCKKFFPIFCKLLKNNARFSEIPKNTNETNLLALGIVHPVMIPLVMPSEMNS